MHFTVVTIFPELFGPFVRTSLVGRASEAGLIGIHVADLRDYTDDPHRVVDDEPFGGGAGMVMKAAPWIRATRDLANDRAWRVLLSPQGRPLTDQRARELAGKRDLILLCARYEGVDERVRETVVDEEISIGDYVVAGGEIPAMVLIEAVARQVPGVVGSADSVELDSFRSGLLDYPHYTRPREVEGLAVPEVLLSGNHAAILRWREKEALRNTLRKRPDLLRGRKLSARQKSLLTELESEIEPHAKLND